MTVMTKSQTELTRQVTKDLDRDEGFRQYAYPDPIKPLAKKYPKAKWGFRPAVDILKELGVSVEEAAKDGAPWTVGFGFTKGVTLYSEMQRIPAERRLEDEILERDAALRKSLSWYDTATFATKTVLLNMSFNLGVAGLLTFKNTLAYIKEKNYPQAAANMKKSLWYKQIPQRAQRQIDRLLKQSV